MSLNTQQILPYNWVNAVIIYLLGITKSSRRSLNLSFANCVIVSFSLIILIIFLRYLLKKEFVLNKDNYKTLKTIQLRYNQETKIDLKKHFKEEIKAKWYQRPMITLILKFVDISERLNQKIDIAFQSLDQVKFEEKGLRVIPQNELWERRTTAYKYRK